MKNFFNLMQISTTRFALLLLALVVIACTPVSPIDINTPAPSPLMRPTNINTPIFSPTEDLFPPTPPLNPAMLTPSVESARLGDILMKISADLPCQEYEWSSIVLVDAREAQFECTNTNGENKNTIYISFRLGGNQLGFECFHGYNANSDESSYLVEENGENGKILNSYTRKNRYFTWAAQGVNFTIIELIDGDQTSTLPSPDLREKIFERVTQLGLLTGEGNDCVQ